MRKGFVIPLVIAILAFIAFATLIVMFLAFKPSSLIKSIGGGSSETLASNGGNDISTSSLEAIDCSAVKVPKIYYGWVREAAKRYLGGDEAKLLAVLEFESGFQPSAISGTGAVGLGQFIASTARSKQSFKGQIIITVPRADKVNKTVTAAEKRLFRSLFFYEGRLQPGPSIFASAELLNAALRSRDGNFHKAYAEVYNGETGDRKYQNADKVIALYDSIKKTGCKKPQKTP